MIRILALACFLCLAACTTATTPFGVCPNAPQILHPGADLHGHECTTGDTCMYGACTKSAMQLSGTAAFSVCTKDCSCGPHSTCSDEDDDSQGLHFTCIKASKGAGSECALTCKSLSDCQKVNPKFTACVGSVSGIFEAGAVKVCAMSK